MRACVRACVRACHAGADPGFFSQGGSGGKQCHKDDAGVSGEGTEGGLGGLLQENVEYEVLQERF